MKFLKKKLIKNKPYEIEWVDTFGYSGWFEEKEIDNKEIAVNLTVGYFLKEQNRFIILVMQKEINNTKDFAPYSRPLWIPRGYIKSIRKL